MTLKVVYKAPGAPPEVREVSGDLKSLQGLVGGYLEHVPGFKGGFALFCNEEGKLSRLRPNIVGPTDILVGPVFVSKANAKGDLVSLNAEEVRRVTETLTYLDYANVPSEAN